MSTNTSQSKEPNIKAMCFLKVLINNIIVENWVVMNFYQDKFWFVYWAWPSNWIGYIIQLLQAVTVPWRFVHPRGEMESEAKPIK